MVPKVLGSSSLDFHLRFSIWHHLPLPRILMVRLTSGTIYSSFLSVL